MMKMKMVNFKPGNVDAMLLRNDENEDGEF